MGFDFFPLFGPSSHFGFAPRKLPVHGCRAIVFTSRVNPHTPDTPFPINLLKKEEKKPSATVSQAHRAVGPALTAIVRRQLFRTPPGLFCVGAPCLCVPLGRPLGQRHLLGTLRYLGVAKVLPPPFPQRSFFSLPGGTGEPLPPTMMQMLQDAIDEHDEV